jgi:hypothetical protein
VLNKGLGDFEIEKCSPRGTVKSRMASVLSVNQNIHNQSFRCTIRGAGQIGIKVVFVPSRCAVIVAQDVRSERVHYGRKVNETNVQDCRPISGCSCPNKGLLVSRLLWIIY